MKHVDRRLHYAGAAGLLLLAYLYVWLCIEPPLILHVQQPPFYGSLAFLKESLGHPAGPVGYASAFVTQFFRFGPLGAFAVTSIAVLIAVATRAFVLRLHPAHSLVLQGVPAVMVLLLHSRYGFPLSYSLGILLALLGANAYCVITPRRTVPRLLVFPALNVLLYYVVGGPFLLFVLLAGLFELQTLDHRLRGLGLFLVYGLLGAITPGVAAWLLDVDTGQTYARLLPGYPGSFAFYATLAFCVLVLAFALFGMGRSPGPPGRPTPKVTSRRRFLRIVASPRAIPIVSAAAAVAALLWSYNPEEKFLVRLDYLAQHGRWVQLLDYANHHRNHPVFNTPDAPEMVFAIHDIDQALYHTGHLLDDLFGYPQYSGSPALLLADDTFCSRFRKAYLKRATQLLELGRVNESEYMAHDAWSFLGDRPAVFQHLAFVNILKGRVDGARKYLTTLSRMPFYRGWAEHYLDLIKADPLAASDERLQSIRRVMFAVDCVGQTAFDHEEELLTRLLHDRKQNRMAFEYLMAYYLLRGQSDKVVAYLPALDTLGYQAIPRHYEEALVSYITDKGIQTVDLRGRQIRPETFARYRRFGNICAHCPGGRGALWDRLVSEFGSTYWFYETFGVSCFAPAADHAGAPTSGDAP